ncbi:MAG TPA: shikimate dehydrogenase, partial [Nocardioidaceae bacterium]|nr:shikimate dehydrogenase [Nocardioidaceae bacterium]
VLALAGLGCLDIRLVVRDPDRAADTLRVAERHPARPVVEVVALAEASRDEGPSPDIVVSMIPAVAQGPEVLTLARTAPVVFDVVYAPWPTPLAAFALEEERTLVSGLDLLVHQAALQVGLMTGAEAVPVEAMRAAGERALG